MKVSRPEARPVKPPQQVARKAHPAWHVIILGIAILTTAAAGGAMTFAAMERTSAQALRAERQTYCQAIRVVPADFMCTDSKKCQLEAVFLSGAANVNNGVTRSYCPSVSSDLVLRVPDDLVSPSDEAIAQIKADIGAMDKWQRGRVIRDAFAEQGGPD